MFKIKILSHTLWLLLISGLLISCGGERTQESAQEEPTESAVQATKKKTILFFGNSLTAGFGIDEEEAFAGLIQSKIDSLGLDYKVINGGLSGETTASGLNRLDWFLEEEPAIFLLELGGNDGLRGISVNETRKNLQMIIQKVHHQYPQTKILLAGMQIPPNMGKRYTEDFRKIYPEIAEEEQVTLIPFLLEGVAGEKALNLPDGIHPTEEGHQIVAETVWKYLEPML